MFVLKNTFTFFFTFALSMEPVFICIAFMLLKVFTFPRRRVEIGPWFFGELRSVLRSIAFFDSALLGLATFVDRYDLLW